MAQAEFQKVPEPPPAPGACVIAQGQPAGGGLTLGTPGAGEIGV